MEAQWNNPRKIAERIYIQGCLYLETPTNLGCGDAEGLLDMALMRDAYSGGFLLTGSTLTGALRNYLIGLGNPYAERASKLFGDVDEKNQQSEESWLIIEDAISIKPNLEIRDGVAISSVTGTAVNQAKYDIELLSAGTIFNIGFELLVPKNDSLEMKETLAIALLGLEQGEINLGKRKRRGFGKCKVTGWRVLSFVVSTPEGMIEWLENWPLPDGKCNQRGIDKLLLGSEHKIGHIASKSICTLKADFSLDSPIMIRSTPEIKWDKEKKVVGESPDMIHLRSWRDTSTRPIISGTSLAGVLRSRSERICKCLHLDGEARVKSLFGDRKSEKPTVNEQKLDGGNDQQMNPSTSEEVGWKASRLWVDEVEITGKLEENLIQTRVMIDRFTGGAHSGALFSEQPVFPLPNNKLSMTLRLELSKQDDKELTGDIAFLLLLLKDLWTGDLPIGGESGVGRGRWKGISAELTYSGETWKITNDENESFKIDGDQKILEGFLAALKRGE